MGLAAWFHNCNKAELAAVLKLRPEQRVLFAQTVGWATRASRQVSPDRSFCPTDHWVEGLYFPPKRL